MQNNVEFGKMGCVITLFCLATALAAPAQTFTTVLSFDGNNGEDPGSLIQGTDGNLYGVAGGGTNMAGEVYRVTPAGKLAVLYNFCSQPGCADGAAPVDTPVLGSDGNFYGVTNRGGNSDPNCDQGCGTVFKITPSGNLTTLYRFCSQSNCPDGFNPRAGLVMGVNGNFYGTTYYGGPNFSGIAGTVFKITPAGNFTTLYSFCAKPGCADGQGPLEPLTLAANGNFYGSTSDGGAHAGGTIFEITPSGDLATLDSLPLGNEFNGPDPNTLLQASNGSFYGTTSGGGVGSCPGGCGILFQMSTGGTLTQLYNFCTQNNCPDGANSHAALIQATDGNLYGTNSIFGAASGGGAGGTVFQVTPRGLTTIHDFCNQTACFDGSEPFGALTQATNGTFYGTTTQGGTSGNCIAGCGTLYSLSMGLGPFVAANPGFGKVGQSVNILGNNLAGTTSVTFNGKAATFSVVSGTYLKATVPTGATTGKIKVTTPGGTLLSNTAFHILP